MNKGEEKYKDAIFSLWEKTKKGRGSLIPLWYKSNKTGGVIVLGINPSKPAHTKKTKISKNKYISDYLYRSWSEHKSQKIIRNQKKHVEFHPYFTAIKKILGDILNDDQWDWQDIFGIRETSQASIKEKVKSKFYYSQFLLSLKLLVARNPKLILCANAYAMDLLESRIIDQKVVGRVDCFYQLLDLCDLGAKYPIPIIFSCPFGGQRAMDHGIRSLYKWNLQNVLKALKGSRPVKKKYGLKVNKDEIFGLDEKEKNKILNEIMKN